MNIEKRKYYKNIIEDEIEEIQFEISELEDICKPIPPDDAYGRISRMDAINQKSRNIALLNNAKIKMVNLKQALETLNSDPERYGICIECNNKISEERLMFLPETNKCKLHA